MTIEQFIVRFLIVFIGVGLGLLAFAALTGLF